MCGTHPYPPFVGSLEIQTGEGVFKTKSFKGKCEPQLKFPERRRGSNQKNLCGGGGGGDIFWNNTMYGTLTAPLCFLWSQFFLCHNFEMMSSIHCSPSFPHPALTDFQLLAAAQHPPEHWTDQYLCAQDWTNQLHSIFAYPAILLMLMNGNLQSIGIFTCTFNIEINNHHYLLNNTQ